MNNDWNFGSLDGRELTVRWIVPFHFSVWKDDAWRFAPVTMLNPMLWWRAARGKMNWRLWWRHWHGATHRCYCDTGSMFDCSLVLCGFGVILFYSHFTGDVPCPCDVVIEEMHKSDIQDIQAS